MLWKIDIKKIRNHYFKRSYLIKTRRNLKSKVQFSESSINFFQSSVIFCSPYSRGYMAEDSAFFNPRLSCQQLAGLKGWLMYCVINFHKSCQDYIVCKTIVTLNLVPEKDSFWGTSYCNGDNQGDISCGYNEWVPGDFFNYLRLDYRLYLHNEDVSGQNNFFIFKELWSFGDWKIRE